MHGTAGTDWVSLLKHVILTFIQARHVLSAHNLVTVSCVSQAAADVTNAMSKASPRLLGRPGSAAGPLEHNLTC